MDFESEKEKLVKKLNKKEVSLKVVVMPHFCVDNFVHYGKSFDSFLKELEKIAAQGGGNIPVKQVLHRGGKAANCASALASLGTNVSLIAKTNMLGYKLLEHFFAGKQIDLSHVKTDGELAFTTAIELQGVNIMISYAGSLQQFGPEVLTPEDEKLIKDADVLCLSDWGLNERGSELANYIFTIAKEGKTRVFFDPGDPTPKGSKEAEEIKKIKGLLRQGLVDALSVNENEIERYGGKEFLRNYTRVDFHTEQYVKSYSTESESERVPTFKVNPMRLTGAGDAWNAGDIVADALSLSDEQRLLLANATAAFYIAHPEGKHATLKELADFILTTELRKL